MMPAEYADVAGVRLATVAPQNPANGRPRVQGIFVLLNARTLAPTAIPDGIELTARTPAVSLLAARDRLLATTDPLDILVLAVASPQGGADPHVGAHSASACSGGNRRAVLQICGMGWQDVVVARAVLGAGSPRGPQPVDMSRGQSLDARDVTVQGTDQLRVFGRCGDHMARGGSLLQTVEAAAPPQFPHGRYQ